MEETNNNGKTKYTGPEIIFENVTKEYDNGVKALDSVSFNISSGEFAFLMGHSGSGKSSLIKLLMLEERPSSGNIIVGNTNLNEIKGSNIPKFRRNIGVVFQDFRLIQSKTVYENIAFAMEIIGSDRATINKQVDIALELVGLKHKKFEKPNCLSGGEQQRVAIARAVVNLPGMIIADEPTGNLDPKNSVEIMQLLKKINDMGATVLIATHEDSIVRNFSQRVIQLDHGVRQIGQE
jgi:cell division transport system ATP-binding protein